jgi:DNA-binding transcriptional LysR family regulator
MNLTLRQLRYLVLVAETGSITAAARSCRIAQSSILAAVAQAEAEMGSTLFDRRPSRGVTPTPAGERFVAAARRLLAAEAEFERTMDKFNLGMPPVLKIGCFEPFGALFMPELLHRFTAANTSEIQLFEGEQPQLLTWVESNTVDVIVAYDIGPGLPPDAVTLAHVPAHALLNVDDPLAQKERLSLEELVTRPLVLLDLPQTSGYLVTLFDLAGQRPKISFRTRGYDTVRAAVACGFGMSILNMRPIGLGSPDSDRLVRRPLIEVLPAPRLMIADRYGNAKPAFLRRFIELAQAFFAEMGPERYAVALPERYASLTTS